VRRYCLAEQAVNRCLMTRIWSRTTRRRPGLGSQNSKVYHHFHLDLSGYPEVTIHLSLWIMHKLSLFEIQLYVDQAR
jgi:hypothetical protein